MTAVISDPAVRMAERTDAHAMDGADPYGLGFDSSSYINSGIREITVYELGQGRTAYFSFSEQSGYAVVVREADGREPYAGRVTSAQEASLIVSRYIA